MSEITVQHAKNLTADQFNILCQSTDLALGFFHKRFYIKINSGFVTKMNNELVNWCHTNCIDLYHIDKFGENTFSIYFLSEDDAACFKITWCKD